MHPEAYNFVKSVVEDRQFENVLEIGSLFINGSVKDLVDTPLYWGIDLQDGPGVDEVADGATYRLRDRDLADCIVCCEVLEHAKRWRQIVENAYRNLRTGGLFIVTCATDPRAPHSAFDGGPLRPGEYYQNVGMGELMDCLVDAGFDPTNMPMHLDKRRGDLYAVAEKP